MAFVIFLAFLVFLQAAHGELVCEELPVEMCSYSIASTGKRCVLENDESNNLQCKTSEVIVLNIQEHIETDECITACGLDRTSVGISSDALAEPKSVNKLCSANCFENCPNVVDLYNNMAVAEGASLPDLCKKQKKQKIKPRRATQVVNPGALGPVTLADAPGTDDPISGADAPVSGPGGAGDPVSNADAPVSGTDDPVSTADAPVSGTDDPVSPADAPVSGANDPVSTANAPVYAEAPTQFEVNL